MSVDQTEQELERLDRRVWKRLSGRWPWIDTYGFVVALIAADIVLFGTVGDDRGWRLLMMVVQSLTLIAALQVSRVKTRTTVTAIVLLCAFLAGGTIIAADRIARGAQSFTPVADGIVFFIGALILAVPTLAIARHLLDEVRQEGVSLNTVFGALSIYLLIGAAYALVYGFFNVGALQLLPAAHMGFFNQTTTPVAGDFVYFSFITLTTVGYGDFTPAWQLGRMLAVSEALFGQLYLVTVVAVLVSNLGMMERKVRAKEFVGDVREAITKELEEHDEELIERITGAEGEAGTPAQPGTRHKK